MSDESLALSNPHALLRAAIEKGINPDQLGKLVDLAERWERNQAAREFAYAMTGFQAEVPSVFKGRLAGADGAKVKFAFASLDDIMRAAAPVLSKYKIVVTFTTAIVDRGVNVTCRVRVGTHSEESQVCVPIPSGSVNNTQLYGQAVTYGKRYAMVAALGITLTDDDNDAARCMDTIDREQADELKRLIEEKGVNADAFLKWVAEAAKVVVDRIDEVPTAIYDKAIDLLRRKKGEGDEVKITPGVQYDDAYWQARRGKITASEMGAILTSRTLKPAAASDAYINRLVGDLFDPLYPRLDGPTNQWMRQGTAREHESRLWYAMEHGVEVQQVSLCLTDDERFAGSPYGLIGEDGILECKNPAPATHVGWYREGVVPPEHLMQCHGLLIVTGRQWVDWVSYCPGFPPLVVRVVPDKVTAALAEALESVHARLTEVVALFQKETA